MESEEKNNKEKMEMNVNTDEEKKQNKKEINNTLKQILEKNDPLLSKNNPDYMASVADVMMVLTGHSSFGEVMKLSGNIKNLHKNTLDLDANHFQSLFSQGVFSAYMPAISGGGIKKAITILKKAESNANEKWQRFVTYLWLSQIYMKNMCNLQKIYFQILGI